MSPLIECVPNFSEGRDQTVIDAIVSAIRREGVQVLHTDRGEGANRTVVTFAGPPDAVCEAAFRGAETAARLIDMRRHHGAHPRLGATDVLPLIPLRDISLETCAGLARELAARMYRELGIPCYCYEAAALRAPFRKLEACRAGEYEALGRKIADPALRPDFSPDTLTPTAQRTGGSIVGARNFLVAVNFNLATADKDLAMEIARDVRESGRVAGGVRIKGRLPGCKAIGWYIEEYGIAQVSMNITDIDRVTMTDAFREVSRCARRRGTRVTGTELIGLVPLRALPPETVGELRLDDLRPFDPRKKVIEYLLEDAGTLPHA